MLKLVTVHAEKLDRPQPSNYNCYANECLTGSEVGRKVHSFTNHIYNNCLMKSSVLRTKLWLNQLLIHVPLFQSY